ncbi:MAG: aromatic ring-hydroxylating oxygenase subunit alpha, partial [Woeseiaceae bacterium]
MAATNGAIFSPENFAKTRAPIDRAHPLPAEVYLSQEWYDREIDTIFTKSWLLATREEEIPNPGDYVRIDIIGEPLIILRDREGTIRALSAACRHRGAELVSGKGNCSRLVCPYHAWTYKLSGELIGAPLMEGALGFDKAEHNLPTVRAETWGGFVFINFDADATPLLESLGGLPERLGSYAMEDMVVTRKWENRFNANWKVWVENSREGYHVPSIHRESLNTFYPGFKYSGFKAKGEPGVYIMNTSDIETGLYVPRDKTLPFIDGLSAEDQACTHFMIFYPHLLLNLPPDRITFHQYFPEGPEWTRIVTWCCFPKSTVELPNFEKDVEEKYYPQMRMFIDEDKGVCEIVQRGIGGRLNQMGRYSPSQEETVHEFSNWV